MRVYILWDEDGHVVKVCLSKESAITFIKDLNETDRVIESRYSPIHDLDLEAAGARYRLEEREAD